MEPGSMQPRALFSPTSVVSLLNISCPQTWGKSQIRVDMVLSGGQWWLMAVYLLTWPCWSARRCRGAHLTVPSEISLGWGCPNKLPESEGNQMRVRQESLSVEVCHCFLKGAVTPSYPPSFFGETWKGWTLAPQAAFHLISLAKYRLCWAGDQECGSSLSSPQSNWGFSQACHGTSGGFFFNQLWGSQRVSQRRWSLGWVLKNASLHWPMLLLTPGSSIRSVLSSLGVGSCFLITVGLFSLSF